MTQNLVLSALVGAAAAVVVGWVANWVRASTETRQWEREKLHEAYEAFLAAHEHMLTLFGRGGVSKHTDLAMGWRDVYERIARMQLLAPPEIVASANQLVKVLGTYQITDDTVKMMARVAEKDPSKWNKRIEQRYVATSNEHVLAKAAFIEAARADLVRRRTSWIETETTRLMRSVIARLQREL
jgi:hypothetical protein